MLLANTKENYIAFEIDKDANIPEVINAIVQSGYWVRTAVEKDKFIIYVKEVSNNGN